MRFNKNFIINSESKYGIYSIQKKKSIKLSEIEKSKLINSLFYNSFYFNVHERSFEISYKLLPFIIDNIEEKKDKVFSFPYSEGMLVLKIKELTESQDKNISFISFDKKTELIRETENNIKNYLRNTSFDKKNKINWKDLISNNFFNTIESTYKIFEKPLLEYKGYKIDENGVIICPKSPTEILKDTGINMPEGTLALNNGYEVIKPGHSYVVKPSFYYRGPDWWIHLNKMEIDFKTYKYKKLKNFKDFIEKEDEDD